MLQTKKKVKVMLVSPPISRPGAIIMVILVGSGVDKVMPVAPQIVKVFWGQKKKKFYCIVSEVQSLVTSRGHNSLERMDTHFFGIVNNIFNLHSTLHDIYVVWQPQ